MTKCVDVEGGFVCEGCIQGAQPKTPEDESACVDIDECSETPGICGTPGTCSNHRLGYECVCEEGYQYDPTVYGSGCIDIDECATDICARSRSVCTNTIGRYYCDCPQGWYFDEAVYNSGCQGHVIALLMKIAYLQKNTWEYCFACGLRN
ncbi:adhesion G protein-coupled receptor L4-like [Symsagittifera roscoffensis]|uniref:adhesion G protein-coupled receptor L4-like n=1 Tax=Symsagittifera roscoffensis TaxID=84072 RepID=UPI00307B8238